MADRQFFTQECAMNKADIIKTSLATSKLRLVKENLAFSDFTTRAQLRAAEADFNGYPSGGYSLAAFSAPVKEAQGGAIITAPLVNATFNTPTDPPVGNTIYGWWIEDADGDVRLVGTYNPGLPMLEVGDGFSLVVQMVEGRNALPPA